MAKKREVYTVSKRQNKGGWKVSQKGVGVLARGDNKEDVVQAAIGLANLQKKAALRIEKEDGQVQEERTYPRGANARPKAV
jgi:Uncharacterized protein conserved in bacteria (DUF2188)